MITTSINYPQGMPAPQWAENSYKTVSPNLRTPMESGRAMQRRKFSSVPTMREAAWVFTSNEALIFELFYKEDLKDGTEWFNLFMRHPLGYVPMVCRMVDIYDGPVAWGVDGWKYTATLEIWERPLLEGDWILLPDYIIGSGIFDAAMNREWPAA